ncbi:integrase, partial [Acinetobacter baumannii]
DNDEPNDGIESNLIVKRTLPPASITASLNNRYQIAATSDNTRRAYQADIRHYETWGGQLPATTDSILRYLHAFADTLNPRT